MKKIILFIDSVCHNSNIRFAIIVIPTVLFIMSSYLLLLWYLHTIPERPVFSEYYISSGSEIPERIGGNWTMSLPILDNDQNICLVDSTFNCVLIISKESIFSNILKQKNSLFRRKKNIMLKVSPKHFITILIKPNTLYVVGSTNKVEKTKSIRWGTADGIKNTKQDYFLGNDTKVDCVYKLVQEIIEIRDEVADKERKKNYESYKAMEKRKDCGL